MIQQQKQIEEQKKKENESKRIQYQRKQLKMIQQQRQIEEQIKKENDMRRQRQIINQRNQIQRNNILNNHSFLQPVRHNYENPAKKSILNGLQENTIYDVSKLDCENKKCLICLKDFKN